MINGTEVYVEKLLAKREHLRKRNLDDLMGRLPRDPRARAALVRACMRRALGGEDDLEKAER